MSKIIDFIQNYVKETNEPLISFSACYDGGETETVSFYPANRCQDIYSVAKAFTVCALGILYDRGLLKLDDKITDILSEFVPDKIDERWHNITVEDTIKHRIGFSGSWLDIDCYPQGYFGTDFLKCCFTTEFTSTPCVDWVYTDAAYYILSRVVEKITGETLHEFMQKELFTPLDFIEAAWSTCPMGHSMGATGLYITTYDMVKLGEVYRQGGTLNGKRILSREWVDMAINKQFEWYSVEDGKGYFKGGMYGQMLCVYPEKKLTFSWHGYGFEKELELMHRIYTEF